MALYGPAADLVGANPAFLDMYRSSIDDMRSIEALSLVHPEDRELVASDFIRLASREIEAVDREIRCQRPDGTTFHCRSRVSTRWSSDGRSALTVVIVEDVTEARERTLALEQSEEELRRSQDVLEHQARHDPLTGLVNRGHLERELPRWISEERIAALLYLDLDRFKEANDSLGHSAGDELLRIVARRIAGVLRQGDLIARLGGDEFVVLLGPEAAAAGPWNIAARIRRAVAAPCWIGDEQVTVTASIGVARPSDPGTTAEELLRRGDRAMYEAKAHGRDRTEELDAPAGPGEQSLLARRGELRGALVRSELELHYQPEVLLQDKTIRGAEALIRWNHPTRGLVSAAAFIGLAEDAGMMHDIGSFVIRDACEAARTMQTAFGPGFTTRINLSARQLDDDDLELTLDDAIRASGARPESICLEITETAVMRDAHVVLRRLHSLSDRGFKLAIDDFGTGYSSLSYLKRFPIDVLKIDRSFVSGLGEDPHETTIVAAIVQMASALDLQVVAEGIETDQQRGELLRLGCERGQGYLFARPMPLEALLAVPGEAAERSGAAPRV